MPMADLAICIALDLVTGGQDQTQWQVRTLVIRIAGGVGNVLLDLG